LFLGVKSIKSIGGVMRKKLTVGIALLAVMGLSLAAFAASASTSEKTSTTEKPGGVITKSAEMTATVMKLDVKKRTAVLADSEGNTRAINIKPDLKNLDRVKVGDVVRINYTQTVSLKVRKSSTGAGTSVESQETVEQKGMPGRTKVDTMEFVATVEAIDYKTREVTLRGPQGNEESFVVDKSVKKLKNVKVGDEVVVTVTETLAIAVEAVEKP
jgi:hypothetical protein